MFKSALASDPDWRRAAAAALDKLGVVEDANFGFLYTTEPLAPHLAEILSHLREATGIKDWVGAVGMGICGPGEEFYDEPAIAVMTAALPANGFKLFADQAGLTTPGDWPDGLPFVLAHADSANPDILELVDELSAGTDNYVIGGMTASQTRHHQIAGEVTGGGVSGVVFSPEISLITSLSQGCRPVGPTHTITRASDNYIFELDDRPALEVLKDDVGAGLASDLRRLGGFIHAALPIAGSDTGDYVVRNLIGVDEEHSVVAIGETVEAGDTMMFVSRDADAAQDDLAKTLESLQRRAGGEAKGGLYISCIARGPHMFGAQNAEMTLLRDIVGDIPLVGMYANGEISNNRLYSYTGILTLFL